MIKNQCVIANIPVPQDNVSRERTQAQFSFKQADGEKVV
jgi:hypothetical protein